MNLGITAARLYSVSSASRCRKCSRADLSEPGGQTGRALCDWQSNQSDHAGDGENAWAVCVSGQPRWERGRGGHRHRVKTSARRLQDVLMHDRAASHNTVDLYAMKVASRSAPFR